MMQWSRNGTTYHCQSTNKLGWGTVLGCGNLVDEVGTKTNDRNEARKL